MSELSRTQHVPTGLPFAASKLHPKIFAFNFDYTSSSVKTHTELRTKNFSLRQCFMSLRATAGTRFYQPNPKHSMCVSFRIVGPFYAVTPSELCVRFGYLFRTLATIGFGLRSTVHTPHTPYRIQNTLIENLYSSQRSAAQAGKCRSGFK